MTPGVPSIPTDGITAASAMRRGTPLVLIGHLASQLIGLATLAILYRLLDPADYGSLGAVLPAVMLPRMAATLGPGIAVLQRRELSHCQLSVLFWLQIFVGSIAAAVTVGLCWILALRYAQPALFPLGAALAGGTLFAAVGNQHQALLERDLRFGAGSLLRLAGQIIACAAAVAWALRWPNVWALGVQHVVELVVLCAGGWLLTHWRPTWPQRPWNAGEVLPLSAAYSASSLVQFLSQNMEKILLPLLFGEAGNRALGLYSQAFGLMIKPVYLLTTPLTGVMVSSLAKAPVGSELYAAMTTRFFRLSALGLFPCAIGLALVSDEVVLLLGGEEWREAGLLLRWLAPSLVAVGLMNLGIFVLASRGMGRALLVASLWLLVLTIQAAAAGIFAGRRTLPDAVDPAYPASVGLAAAFTLVNLLVWCGPFLWFTLRSVGVPPLQVFAALWPAARGAALMGAMVYGMKLLLTAQAIDSPAVRLSLLIATGILSYLALNYRELSWLRQEWQPAAAATRKKRAKKTI